MKINGIIKSVSKTLSKNSPTILLVVGVGGLITTSIFASKATLKAKEVIDEKKREKMPEINPPKSADEIELTKAEVVKAVWKYYIPTVALAGSSIGCIIGSTRINSKRTAAVVTAYKLSEAALAEYQEKLVEVVGEKKAAAIKEKVDLEKLKKHPLSQSQVIFTGKGETLCFDPVSGRYFKSDIEKIRATVNYLNKNLMNEMYISANEFWEAIGLEPTDIGDDLGWNIDDGLIDITFTYGPAENDEPCLILGYHITPRWDYRSLH